MGWMDRAFIACCDGRMMSAVICTYLGTYLGRFRQDPGDPERGRMPEFQRLRSPNRRGHPLEAGEGRGLIRYFLTAQTQVEKKKKNLHRETRPL